MSKVLFLSFRQSDVFLPGLELYCAKHNRFWGTGGGTLPASPLGEIVRGEGNFAAPKTVQFLLR